MTKTVSTSILATVITGLLLSACASRYRLDLFVVEGGQPRKANVEKTQFVRKAALGDPLAVDKLVEGEGNCLILSTGHRGSTVAGAEDLMYYDRYLRYGVYLQLPATVEPGQYDLIDNSFVQLLETYEIPAEDKLFFPTDGFLRVDSIPDNKLFGTLKANFENHRGQSIEFDGQFKADLKD